MTRIAAVDVGSNSVLMCIGEILADRDFRVVYDSARTTRLGEGLVRTGRLGRGPVRRTLEVLDECRRKAQILGVGIARAVATSTVRNAANREDLLVPAGDVLGFPVEVVSAEQEAELMWLGVAGRARTDPSLVLNVGGSSTAILLANEGRIERTECLPIGARSLKEAIPSEDVLRFFARVIEVIPTDLDPLELANRRTVATGGTATTLAAMRLSLRRYDPDAIEGTSFTRDEIAGLVDRLRALSIEDRTHLPGLSSSRADIIASGGTVFVQILEDLGVTQVSISARGLRHGVLFELARGRG